MLAWQRFRRNIITYMSIAIVMWGIMPFIFEGMERLIESEAERAYGCMLFMQVVFPVIALMVPMTYSLEDVAGIGCELLYVGDRVKAYKYIASYVIYAVLAYPLYVYASGTCCLYNYRWEYIRGLIIIAFLYGIYYLIIYATGNYLVAIVSICAYIVYSAFTENDGSRLKFVNACFADQALIEEWYIPFLCVGIIALLAGVLFNDKFEKFN